MSLKESLRTDLTTAIRGRDELVAATLRMVPTAVTTEEVAGTTAQEAGELLRGRGVRPWLVLDEGGAVVDAGVLPGVGRSAAMVAVADPPSGRSN